AAEAWPSIRWTAFTLAPAETARLAAVCLSSCGVSPAAPACSAAASNQPRRALRLRSGAPVGDVNTRALGSLPARYTANSSTTKRGSGTERDSWDFGGAPLDASAIDLDHRLGDVQS